MSGGRWWKFPPCNLAMDYGYGLTYFERNFTIIDYELWIMDYELWL